MPEFDLSNARVTMEKPIYFPYESEADLYADIARKLKFLRARRIHAFKKELAKFNEDCQRMADAELASRTKAWRAPKKG